MMPDSLTGLPLPLDRVEVIFSIDELADFLKKSRATIYSELTRRPHALPPRIKIPGSNRVLFRDPPAWLAQFVEAVPEKPGPAEAEETTCQPRRRGAPTKAERLQRKKAAGASK